MFMHIKAFEVMDKLKRLPCNVKFIIEGEEEIGSVSFYKFVEEHKEKLKNDIVLVSDTAMLSNEIPSVTIGLRGLSYIEIEVSAINRDLHSGIYGGAVPNPLNILSKMIGSLHDGNHRITIPHFYDKVDELSAEERIEMAHAPFDLNQYKNELKLKDIQGEKDYTTIERTSIRPTLDVNGMWGGYTGEGAKTIIPSKAFAKISTRLVPYQNHDEITQLLIEHFKKITPNCVKVKVTPHHGANPYVMPTEHLGYKAAFKSMEYTYGIKPIPVRSGGSIPIASLFEQKLGSKTVLMGFGLDTDAIHSPNEHFGLNNFYKGIETIPYFYKYFAEMYLS